MIIKKVKLKNIRSYVEGEIDFPEGASLLAGDIGSGKSSVLLAIDFALFGLQRGELTGAALLRNGESESFVELFLDVKGREIQIKRFLKRGSSGISQDIGFLVVDDVPEQLTPVELKQRILSLLNYPQEALTKKSLIYRYTVYTPQEEMKAILTGDKESRLEILRKVFNIDKYKRVKDNTKILIQELRNKRKEFASAIYDLEEKKKRLEENKNKLVDLRNRLELVDDKALIEEISNTKKFLKDMEEKSERLIKLKQEFMLVDQDLKSKGEVFSKGKERKDVLVKEIESLILETKTVVDKDVLRKQIYQYEDTIKKFEENLNEVLSGLVELRTKKEHSDRIKSKMNDLDKCPVCMQEVTLQHKSNIISLENKNILSIKKEMEKFIIQEQEIKNVLESAKKKLGNLKENELRLEMLLLKKEDLEKKKSDLDILKKEEKFLVKVIGDLKYKKVGLEKEISLLKDIESEIMDIKKKLDELFDRERKIELEKATLTNEIKIVQSFVDDLVQEVEKKEGIKSKLEKYTEMQNWMNDVFLVLVEQMERKVMRRVHFDFSGLFEKWFSALVDDVNLQVSLDEEFSPVILQNNYDLDYSFLSGGEKTACALAYRLALNQVINSLVSLINTKDLIILDEPTDGFSSTQLEKMRGVLDELSVRQVIIVSHEKDVESFVDNVIRMKKENGESFVV